MRRTSLRSAPRRADVCASHRLSQMEPNPTTPRSSQESAGERFVIRLVLVLFVLVIAAAVYFAA